MIMLLCNFLINITVLLILSFFWSVAYIKEQPDKPSIYESRMGYQPNFVKMSQNKVKEYKSKLKAISDAYKKANAEEKININGKDQTDDKGNNITYASYDLITKLDSKNTKTFGTNIF